MDEEKSYGLQVFGMTMKECPKHGNCNHLLLDTTEGNGLMVCELCIKEGEDKEDLDGY